MAQDVQERLTRRRVEAKIRLPRAVAESVVSRLPSSGERVGDIVTVYFDRPDGLLARQALSAPDEAVKVRVRDYQDGAPVVWMEVKERRAGWVHKTRLPLPREAVEAILVGKASPLPLCRCEDCRRMAAEALGRLGLLWRGPWMRVGAVAVRRRTFYFGTASLRATLDENVEYFRLDADPFADGRTPSREVLSPALHRDPDAILEVKHAGDLPDWWRDIAPPGAGNGLSKFLSLLRHLKGGSVAPSGERS